VCGVGGIDVRRREIRRENAIRCSGVALYPTRNENSYSTSTIGSAPHWELLLDPSVGESNRGPCTDDRIEAVLRRPFYASITRVIEYNMIQSRYTVPIQTTTQRDTFLL
jgi:hypothetical protein